MQTRPSNASEKRELVLVGNRMFEARYDDFAAKNGRDQIQLTEVEPVWGETIGVAADWKPRFVNGKVSCRMSATRDQWVDVIKAINAIEGQRTVDA